MKQNPPREFSGKKQSILFLESGSGFGGSSRCLFLLLKHLDNSFSPFVLYDHLGPNIEMIRRAGIATQRNSLIALLLRLPQAELVYINNELYSHIRNIVLAKLFGKKIICHVRGIRALTKREKAIAGWIDQFIAVSSACKKNLVSEGIPESKIDVIYDGVAQEEAAPRCLNNGLMRAGVVGRISRQKGQGVFIEAARLLLSAGRVMEFYIIGDDVSEGKPDLALLQQGVRQHQLESKVHFTGWKKDTKEIYGGLDIVVCPSLLNEALGNVVIESMTFGKPVVASRTGAYSEMIEDGSNGLLFEPGNAKDLAQKIELLLSDKDLREKLAQNACRTAKDKFDIKTNVAKIKQLINEQTA